MPHSSILEPGMSQRMDKTMRPRAKPISLKVPGGALLLAGMPDGVHCF
jgi:hypothetical protein